MKSAAEDADDEDTSIGERLQKLIARAGIASRRAAEEMIAQGRVSVNGHVIREMGAKADPQRDRIVVDGKPLRLPTGPSTVLLLHKPKGVVTTRKDPEGRMTVLDLLPRQYQHLHPVGRLDYDTSGVLLLTDDGELTQFLTHPSQGVEKVYQARVRGQVSVPTIKKLEAGIYLEDGKTAPCRVRVRAQTENNALVQITLHEGRNRQVRRMLEAVGHPVSALRRVRFAGLNAEGVPSGSYRTLLPGEVRKLRKLVETPKPKAASGKGASDTQGKKTSARPKKAIDKSGPGARPPKGKDQRDRTPQPSTSRSGKGPSHRPGQNVKPQAAPLKPSSQKSRPSRASSAQSTARPASTKTTSPKPPRKSPTPGSSSSRSTSSGSTSSRSSTPRSSARSHQSQDAQHPLARRIEERWKRTQDT